MTWWQIQYLQAAHNTNPIMTYGHLQATQNKAGIMQRNYLQIT